MLKLWIDLTHLLWNKMDFIFLIMYLCTVHVLHSFFSWKLRLTEPFYSNILLNKELFLLYGAGDESYVLKYKLTARIHKSLVVTRYDWLSSICAFFTSAYKTMSFWLLSKRLKIENYSRWWKRFSNPATTWGYMLATNQTNFSFLTSFVTAGEYPYQKKKST